jgi:hypothetical protein
VTCAPPQIYPSSVSRRVSSSHPPFSVAAHPSCPSLCVGSVPELPRPPHRRFRARAPSTTGELCPNAVLTSLCVTGQANLLSAYALAQGPCHEDIARRWLLAPRQLRCSACAPCSALCAGHALVSRPVGQPSSSWDKQASRVPLLVRPWGRC